MSGTAPVPPPAARDNCIACWLRVAVLWQPAFKQTTPSTDPLVANTDWYRLPGSYSWAEVPTRQTPAQIRNDGTNGVLVNACGSSNVSWQWNFNVHNCPADLIEYYLKEAATGALRVYPKEGTADPDFANDLFYDAVGATFEEQGVNIDTNQNPAQPEVRALSFSVGARSIQNVTDGTVDLVPYWQPLER